MFHCKTCNTIEWDANRANHIVHKTKELVAYASGLPAIEFNDWSHEIESHMRENSIHLSEKTPDQLLEIMKLFK